MRDNLSTEIAREIRKSIVRGDIVPDERINEVDLAKRLEVSRTPLREALSHLVAEGFVENRPRRGFFVRAPDAGEVRDLYAIRAILDPAALERAGVPEPPRLESLAALNARIREAVEDPERAIDLDDAWHLELLSGTANGVLMDLIRHFMRRTRTLERAYLSDRRNVEAMAEAHDRILRALGERNLEAAVQLLRENLEDGMIPVLEWLEARPAEAAAGA